MGVLEVGRTSSPVPMPPPAQQCWGLVRGGPISLIRGGVSSPVPIDINMTSGGRPNIRYPHGLRW